MYLVGRGRHLVLYRLFILKNARACSVLKIGTTFKSRHYLIFISHRKYNDVLRRSPDDVANVGHGRDDVVLGPPHLRSGLLGLGVWAKRDFQTKTLD